MPRNWAGASSSACFPGGGWVVDDWHIRMPVTEVTLEGNPHPVPGSLRRLREKRKLVAVKEEGGALVGISDPVGQSVGPTGRGSLVGVAFDSTQNAALSHATVCAPGYQLPDDDRRRRDSTRWSTFRPVTYFVTISHPRVGMLRLGSALRPVQIREDARIRVDLAIPSARRLAPTLCPGQERDEGIVVGLVIDALSGDPMQGRDRAPVDPPWWRVRGVRARRAGRGRRERSSSRRPRATTAAFCFAESRPASDSTRRRARRIKTGSAPRRGSNFTVAEDEIHEAIFEIAAPTESLSGS